MDVWKHRDKMNLMFSCRVCVELSRQGFLSWQPFFTTYVHLCKCLSEQRVSHSGMAARCVDPPGVRTDTSGSVRCACSSRWAGMMRAWSSRGSNVSVCAWFYLKSCSLVSPTLTYVKDVNWWDQVTCDPCSISVYECARTTVLRCVVCVWLRASNRC